TAKTGAQPPAGGLPPPPLLSKSRTCDDVPPSPKNSCEAAMAKFRLVSFKTCPWVQRVAVVLREKKIDFEFQHIEPDNRPDWFRAISPHNKVPVLRLDHRVSLFYFGAIDEYLY